MNADILFIIFRYLDVKDINSCSLVNKEFYEVTTHNAIWKRLFINEYNNLYFLQSTYYESYKLCYLLTKFNKRFSLTDSLDKLSTLTTIDLSNRQLIEIPKELLSLTNLQHLGLSGNNIITIPKEITSLINLQTFYLSYNQLTVIPIEISSLTNLHYLAFDHNQLTAIQKKFHHCLI